jgi:hypothetical protein
MRDITGVTVTALVAPALAAAGGASRLSAALVHQFDYNAKAPLSVKERESAYA